MQGRRILLIDDCEDTGVFVRHALESSYDVVQVFTFKESDEVLMHETFLLIIIDVHLPDGNGFDYCEMMVKDPRFRKIPKILLSAEAKVSSRVFGLSCGADDYVVKPFAGTELKARIDARLRNVSNIKMSNFEIEGIRLLPRDMTCIDLWNNNTDLHFTPTEFRILHALAVHTGKTLSRSELVRVIWNQSNVNIATRGLDSHISRIRKKLPKERLVIRSVYTCGYCLEALNLQRLAG